MLQFPPLSISSKNASRKDSDFRRPNDSPRLPPNSLNNKRFQKETFVSRSQFPAIPTNLSPSPASSPSPTPSIIPRTPLLSSKTTSSPISFANSHQWTSTKSSARSAKSSLFSTDIDDVLAIGDLVAQGGTLQGETIRLVSIRGTTSPSELATEFLVKKRLGHGSYAVVYLVQEVLHRSPPSDDGHMPTMGVMELDGKTPAHSETVYGREYAMKCLSKANLDDEDLAAQMSEVHLSSSLLSLLPAHL
jgi:hypothetical protein